MADSFLGEIATGMGATIREAMPDTGEAMKGVSMHISEVLGPMLQTLSESGNSVTTELLPLVQDAHVDVIDAIPDHGTGTADAAPTVTEVNTSTMESLASKLDSMTNDAHAKVASGDPAAALQGQAELQQIQQVTEAIIKTVQQTAEAQKDAIDGLHSNADVNDNTVVAMADGNAAHVTVHADSDNGNVDHSDHSTPGTAHTDSTPADAEGVV